MITLDKHACKTGSFYKLMKNLLTIYDRDEIFIRSNSSLGFPNCEVENVKIEGEGGNNKSVVLAGVDKALTKEVEVNFLGLHGSSSQLPGYILDELARSNDGNEGWSLLLDFFNNYALWLFFDVISVKSYPRSFDGNLNDNISNILLSLLGLTDKAMARTYLPFASLIASRRRPKKQIERLLQRTFNLEDKLSIVENIPHVIPINSTQKNFLGKKNCKLGCDFIIGDTVVSHQTKIGILIKDLSYHEAEIFFPRGAKFEAFKESAIFSTNNEFAIDLYFKIRYSDEMALRTGKHAVRLGWGSSLGKPKKSYYMMSVNLC